MNAAFELLMFAALIGAVDVGYYHLYKFKLYARPESIGEELTHLARHVLFLAITAVMVLEIPGASLVLPVLFGLDLANSIVDVLLERRSRESAGGLPSLEYLIHMLASFTTGAAIAAYVFASSDSSLSQIQIVRGAATIAIGTMLLMFEAGLFMRAVRARRYSAGSSGISARRNSLVPSGPEI